MDGIVGEISAVAVVGSTFLMLVRWLISRLTEDVGESVKAVWSLHMLIMELYKLILSHDAQVRGINPLADVQASENLSLAVSEYKKILDRISRMESIVKSHVEKIDKPGKKNRSWSSDFE